MFLYNIYTAFHIMLIISSLHTLYAQSLRTTLAPLVLPRLLARDWSGLLFKNCHNQFLRKKFYDPKAFFFVIHGIGWIKLALIVQNSALQPLYRVWTVFNSNVVVHSHKSTKDHRLGWLSP